MGTCGRVTDSIREALDHCEKVVRAMSTRLSVTCSKLNSSIIEGCMKKGIKYTESQNTEEKVDHRLMTHSHQLLAPRKCFP